jgi:hypothetical protein
MTSSGPPADPDASVLAVAGQAIIAGSCARRPPIVWREGARGDRGPGRARPPDQQHLLTGVRDALLSALRVPDDDPTVRVEYPPEQMIIPPQHSTRYAIDM